MSLAKEAHVTKQVTISEMYEDWGATEATKTSLKNEVCFKIKKSHK